MQVDSPEFATVTELSRITGFSLPTIKKHIRKGNLQPKGKGKFKKYSFDEFYDEITENQKEDNNRLKSPGKERKLDLECEQLKLRIDESLGKLVDIEKVGEAVDKIFSDIRQNFLTLPAKLAVELSPKATASKIQKILTKEIHGVLNGLSEFTFTNGPARKKAPAKRKAPKTAPTSDRKRVGKQK